MPFSATDSLTSTNMNNTVRGLYRDNADHAVTGTVVETDATSTTISGGAIGSTGTMWVFLDGTSSGAGGAKTVTVYLGSTAIASVPIASGTRSWKIEVRVVNTSSSTQRLSEWQVDANASGVATSTFFYSTAAVDTSSSQALKSTITLASAGDTCTQKTFNAFVCQIT